MSVTYPSLTYTQFPDNVDTINNFIDVTLSTFPLAQEYYAKYNSGDIAGAAQVLSDHPDLKYSFIGASTLNPIVDAIKAIQLFYTADVQQYLMNIVVYKGDYISSTKYVKFNVVKYINASALESYMCINSAVPIGTTPTNTTYWIPLTLRGEQGAAGIGLTSRGTWNSTTTYPNDSMVSYNNVLWGSLVSNTNITPTVSATATWFKVMDFTAQNITYTDTTTSLQYRQLIDNNKIYFENVANNDRLEIAKKSEIPTTLPANGGTAATISEILPISKGGTGGDKASDILTAAGVDASATELNYVDGVTSSIQTQLNTKAVKTTTVSTNLIAANWIGSSAPFSQTVTVSGATSTNNIIFDLSMGVTTAELGVGMDAMLKATAQGTNLVTIKAYGTKPSISIPIQFVILG